jgi:hypothetical protein
MAKTAAEKQRDYRRRQAAARLELRSLRAQVDALTAELERAQSVCARCGGALACPSCYREGEF